jgi:hypothetical protein
LLWPGLTAMAQMPRTPSSMSKAVADSLPRGFWPKGVVSD